MKRKFSVTLIPFLVFAFPIPILAQNISFAYDNAGNRIKREIVVDSKRAPEHAANGESFVEEMLLDKNIRIHPNPTHGMLKIEIGSFESADNGTISIFNTSGIRIISLDITSSITDVDISAYPGGIYILRIIINGMETSWKIIKE